TFMNMGICKFLYILITRSCIVIAQPFKYRRVQWEKAHPMAPVSCVLVRTPYPCLPVPIFTWDRRPSDLLVVFFFLSYVTRFFSLDHQPKKLLSKTYYLGR